jgi:hypothetical protein
LASYLMYYSASPIYLSPAIPTTHVLVSLKAPLKPILPALSLFASPPAQYNAPSFGIRIPV